MATELPAESTSPASGTESVTQVYELDEELLVLVRLQDGLLELRVPAVQAASLPKPHPRVQPEATPC